MKKQVLINYNAVKESRYNAYRNHLSKCKHDFYKEKLEDSKGDIRTIFNLISDAVNKWRRKIIKAIFKYQDSDNLSSFKEMVHYCNEFS